MLFSGVSQGCWVEDLHCSMKFVMKEVTFTINDIKQKIVSYDNNIDEIEFRILDNRKSKEYDSKKNQQIVVDIQTTAIFFELQKIKYKDPEKSQFTRIALKINNKIKNQVDSISMPVYRIRSLSENNEENLAGKFIIFSDFALDKIFTQENVVFYYTKQKRNRYDNHAKEWIYTKDNTKHYLNATNRDDVLIFSSFDFPERYEFFIESNRISEICKLCGVILCSSLIFVLAFYAYSNPNLKITKFLSKEII